MPARPLLTPLLLPLLAGACETGCAVRWSDPDTGTTHLLGVGHLAVVVDGDPTPPQGAMVTSTTLGLDVSRTPQRFGIGLGVSRLSHLVIAPEGASFRIAAPPTGVLELDVSDWREEDANEDD